MLRLLFGLVSLLPPVDAAQAPPEDPYAAMARRLAFAAREANLESLVIVPFKSLESGDALGGRLVAERLALGIGSSGGLQVLDGRQLEGEGGGRRRAPDGPAPEEDKDLYGEVLKQFALHELGVKESLDHFENRKKAEGIIRQRLIDTHAKLDRLASRARQEPPEAQALVTGVLVPLADGRMEIHARLADSGTFAVIASVSAKVPKDWGMPLPPAPPRDFTGPAVLSGAGLALLWFLARAAGG